MINDIKEIAPFVYTPGRAHASFPEIKRSPMLYLNVLEFHRWLNTHKEQIALI